MHKLIVMMMLAMLSLFFINCATHKHTTGLLRGKLEINGPCSNYVIKVLTAVSDQRVEKTWTDAVSGKVYTNVFTVMNYCTFPANLKQGDEFYFQFINEPPTQNCMRCMIYVPTPEKQNAIMITQPK